jgi:hypothetical protein
MDRGVPADEAVVADCDTTPEDTQHVRHLAERPVR